MVAPRVHTEILSQACKFLVCDQSICQIVWRRVAFACCFKTVRSWASHRFLSYIFCWHFNRSTLFVCLFVCLVGWLFGWFVSFVCLFVVVALFLLSLCLSFSFSLCLSPSFFSVRHPSLPLLVTKCHFLRVNIHVVGC